MKPFEMVLIDAVLNHLEIVAMYDPRVQRARSVFPHEHVVARQKWRWFRSEIGENDSRQLLNFVRWMTNAFSEGAVGWPAGLVQDASPDVLQPTMTETAQATTL